MHHVQCWYLRQQRRVQLRTLRCWFVFRWQRGRMHDVSSGLVLRHSWVCVLHHLYFRHLRGGWLVHLHQLRRRVIRTFGRRIVLDLPCWHLRREWVCVVHHLHSWHVCRSGGFELLLVRPRDLLGRSSGVVFDVRGWNGIL